MTRNGGDGETGFGEQITKLKESGGNLLVTGTVPAEYQVEACKSLLGATDGPPRRRVLALIGNDRLSADARLPDGALRDGNHFALVEAKYDTRSSVGVGSGEAPGSGRGDPSDTESTDGGPRIRQISGEDLPALTESVKHAIDALTAASDGDPDPGELRLCVDSLVPLFAHHDRAKVLAFCHILARRIEDRRGRGHFHLPLSPDDEQVAALEPVFDVVIELRVEGDVPMQRWRIRGGASSEWIPL